MNRTKKILLQYENAQLETDRWFQHFEVLLEEESLYIAFAHSQSIEDSYLAKTTTQSLWQP